MKKTYEMHQKLIWSGSVTQRTSLRILIKKATAPFSVLLISLLLCVLFGPLVFSRWVGSSIFSGACFTTQKVLVMETTKLQEAYPLRCSQTQNQTCPRDYPTSHNPSHPSYATCPSFFKWINEDLRHWRETGITRDMVERARRTAHFRVVILNGKVYVEKYRKSIQTRDVFTLWGILQLTRLYPGRLPDLELMFDCDDRPVVRLKDFRHPYPSPPPVFRYCADETSLDIVFPDWSFWGWAETNIKPWNEVMTDISEGNKKIKWKDRVPYAYWKGNPQVSPTRKNLMRCNVSSKNDWNTRLYTQDWAQESKRGYSESNLGDQCTHRYKIYVEGWAWSVSEKYILACNSMTLFIRSNFHDFFSRGMMPLQHYWPIRDNSKCSSLKFAVEWGNTHPDMAQAIGEAASNFIQEDLKMGNVYDYMFHLLNEYGKLLRFKPTIPPGAVELCAESMACNAEGTWRQFMQDSIVKSPSDSFPCTMPTYNPSSLSDFLEKKANSTRQVEIWEDQYWHDINRKP